MRLCTIAIVILSGALSLAGCGAPAAVGAGAGRAERARETKFRKVMREAQEAFASPELDEAQADEAD